MPEENSNVSQNALSQVEGKSYTLYVQIANEQLPPEPVVFSNRTYDIATDRLVIRDRYSNICGEFTRCSLERWWAEPQDKNNSASRSQLESCLPGQTYNIRIELEEDLRPFPALLEFSRCTYAADQHCLVIRDLNGKIRGEFYRGSLRHWWPEPLPPFAQLS